MGEGNETRSRRIIISSAITDVVAGNMIGSIITYNSEDRPRKEKEVGFEPTPITLVINTPGGSVTDGFAIISAILTSVTPVHTICLGRAASMGFAIFAAGHKRYAHRMSLFMYHMISGGAIGNLDTIKDKVEYLEMLMRMYDDFILERTKITKEKLDAVKTSGKDWYLTADDAIKLGLVDEIISVL